MTLSIRHDWTTEEIQTLLELPLMELLWQAQTVHREANPGYRVQLASLLSVKTGGCEEDCAYCSQSIHNSSDVTAFEAQMQVEPVLQRARAAKEAGNGYELVFYQKLQEKIDDLQGRGAEEFHFTELRESARILLGAVKWTPDCNRIHQEILAFLQNIAQQPVPENRKIQLTIDL